MGGVRGSQRVAAGLVILFLTSLLPVINIGADELLSDTEETGFKASTLGQATSITVGSWPDGANQRVSLGVPDGHAIESLQLGIEASDLSDSVASSWSEVGDFDQGSVYDGMDVNASSLHDPASGLGVTISNLAPLNPSGVWPGLLTGLLLQTPVSEGNNWPKQAPSPTIKSHRMTLDVSLTPCLIWNLPIQRFLRGQL